MTTFEKLTKDQKNAVLEAKNLVTIENLSALSYGEDLELTNKVNEAKLNGDFVAPHKKMSNDSMSALVNRFLPKQD